MVFLRQLLAFTLSSFLLTWLLCLAVEANYSSSKIGQGYRLISIEETPDGAVVGILQVKEKNNIYGVDIPLLSFYVKHETESRLRVHITDAKKQRWEVPYNLLPREQPPPLKLNIKRLKKNSLSVSEYSSSELVFSYTSDPFSFAVKRKSNGDTLFDSNYSNESDSFRPLVFKDQYLEISTKLPKNASLYGLGENTQPNGMKLHPNDPYTLYTTDISAINLNSDLYGSHPVYMDLRNYGGKPYAHGVLLLNSNGMDVFYKGNSLTYKIIGGILDFYFFAGPTPLNVVDQYTSFIGRPAPMPYWAFGFHQCRWGYHNLSVIEDVVENYKKAKIPLDVIWNDDDHMDGHKDFTVNPVNYPLPKLLNFLDRIHSIGMKYIVINDPGIAVNTKYGVYQRGMANDVFIKYEGEPFMAMVWPGAVYFPDFLNPKTVSWWADEIRRFHELVPIDGLWIDMNEVSNFCTGKCTIPKERFCPLQGEKLPNSTCCLDCTNITSTRWDDPPYKINASGNEIPIGYKTIATSAVHYNGVLEYDAHSLFGFSEAIATHKALSELQGKRPFVLSRSTYVGSGKYAAHWTGDNKGTWEDLRYTISTILNFGIFGMPMVGADICGFYPSFYPTLRYPISTEELCNRWIEVGAFYPFSRDHSSVISPRQELYQWESVAESARNALGMRYKLLPYFYTINYEAHISGAPIARPLFFSFPNYIECYGLSTQFLLGSSLMISPVLEPGKTEVKALFPPGTWYSLFDLTQVIVSKDGNYVTLDAPLHVVNVHLYQNTILPMQQGGMVSKDARMTPFSLIVTFPAGANEGEAKGNLFLDDDEMPEMKVGNGYSTYIDFHASVKEGTVKIWSQVQEGKFVLDKGLVIDTINVLGLNYGSGTLVSIEIDGEPSIGVSYVKVSTSEHKYLFKQGDEEKKTVMVGIKGLNIPVGKRFALTWKMGS
ncbi:putative glycosidase [Medicago truncatula]|uniref:Alpha-glucosidase n=1 Tax=Medicago truncatula TaxID=3880 RepID=A0A072VRC0_MEDTR|nr:alpha-xylosidase 1 [Medicago truncatula]KEH44226.1 alpha-glucosidase [Medicago truncatula]RHN82437.1 putative glycosidase [Medicago truncatula]